MTQARCMLWLGVLGLATLFPTRVCEASILCKTRKGGLVVRDRCKRKEVQLGADQLAALGLKGDLGPQGPPGVPGPPGPPGPSGGGLHVVDANGRDVGLVTEVGKVSSYGYYGTTATTTSMGVICEVPAGTGEFLLFRVSPSGFETASTEYGYGWYGEQAFLDGLFVYTTANCTGTRYSANSLSYSYYGTTAPFMEFAHQLTIDPANGHTGYYYKGSELQTQPYYQLQQVPGVDATAAAQSCTQAPPSGDGGQVIGAVSPCPPDSGKPSGYYCAQCCVALGTNTSAAQVHTLDLSTLGLTPPFRLRR